MSTTIDSLQIEIQSSSNNAAGGIDKLANSLERLKKVGSFNVVIKNLNNLSSALDKLQATSSGLVKLNLLASSIESLKKAGSFGSISTSFAKLGTALKDLESMNIDGVVAKIKELNDKIEPVSKNLVAIGNAFKTVNSKAIQTSGGFSVFGGKVNTTTLNLKNMISVAKSVWSALKPIVNLLKNVIGEAIEWEGIAQRFGRGFGDQAEEVYSWVQRLNKEMGINTQQFMQYSSTYATMLTGFGVASKDASKMATGYMELTYDIWAGYNDIYKSLDDAATAVRSAIAGEVEPVRKAGFTIIESTLEQTAANHGLKISLEKATEAQKSYLRYLTLVDQAKAQGLIGNYAREMNTAEGLMRTFNQQVKSLGQTFGSIFLPALVKVMPWVQAFIDLIGDAIMAVANFFGIDIQKANFGGDLGGIGDGADSATDAVKGTTKAMKELKNATTGIDELNIISPQSGSGGSGAGTGGSGWNGPDMSSLWDESIFEQVQFEVDAIKEQLKEALSGIEAVVSGFALAIGAILVLCANPKTVALGIGLLALGAVGLAHSIAANWDGMSKQLAETLTTVTSTVAGFLLAIGAMMTFTGAAPGLGIALMAAGAVSLATAATINWKFLEGDLKNTLSILTAVVSGGALALGAVLAFSGAKVGLGIALMAAGAVGIVTAAAVNWDFLTEPTRKAIGTIGAIAGGSLLAIGLIIALTGGSLPLGIGLMVAGAASIASSVAINWKSMNGDLKNTLATIGTIVGGALLGIGAILAFTGVNMPLGIAMIAAGAIGIIAAAPINWKSLVNSIKNVLKEIGMAAGAALLALGTLLVCTGVALPTGIALMAAGAASLITGAALNSGTITTQAENTLAAISFIAGTATLALGVILVCSGVALPVGIALIAAGASGLVSGVTLKWDSIKTSIQNGFNKIKEWVSTYGLLALGVILCLTGAGISLGISLIKQGLNKKTDSGSTVGNDLLKTIKEKWNAVKEWWNSKPALKKISTSVENVKTKVSNAWNDAKTWWNSKPALKKISTTVDSILDNLSSAWNKAKTWLSKQALKLNIKIPHIVIGWDYKVPKWQADIANFLFGKKAIPYINVEWYKNGGFPDVGEMFVAREAGPELVGKIGNKNAVANNDQIVEGISAGVYAAVVAAMRASGGNGGGQAVNVYLDGKQITASVEQRQKERGVSLMGSQVYAY